ncbi:hypothetical protein [Streptomyces sp. VRA16 Mangrove soil]|uniref:hypothetical protein n=1 Tax=Streptomyces sp. VRA16 Mangrove soil TaxID=2817434 RepID=UPI001A9E235F|nr:hypothetical protein [Streptomyces sp. VRA16 Mangrove soil]MBO1332029.1 hypothetical protein [Streptomyces sp. VRA16 Mangrove soil]
MIDPMCSLRSAVLAGGVTHAARAVLRRVKPGGAEVWERRNYAGREVDLCPGPAVALGAAAGALAAGPGTRAAALVATLAAGACGAYDDVAGTGDPRRGFRAHLGALRHGELTSGAVKLFGISAAGLVAGALLKERPVDKALAGVVVAGTAHLLNLVDVRPGRAAQVALALGAPGLLRGPLAAAPMAAAAAVLPEDLGERGMLGDSGAHALGAALGVAIVAGNGRAGLVAHAAGLVAATVYGDRVSALAASARKPVNSPM